MKSDTKFNDYSKTSLKSTEAKSRIWTMSNFTFGAPAARTRSRSDAVEEIQPESQESVTGAIGGVSLAEEGRQASLTFSTSSKISSMASSKAASKSSKSSGKF